MNDINLYEKTILIYGKGAKERKLQIGNDDVIYVLEKYKHRQIILYLDRRWYTDERENIFKNIGFVFNGTTSPSSYMVKHDRRTENGENTIYDCGQLIYIYKNS